MDRRFEGTLSYAIYIILVLSMVFMVFDNIDDPWKLFVLSAVFLSSFTIRYLMKESLGRATNILALLEVLLIYIIGLKDNGSSHVIFYYCTAADMVLSKGKFKGLLFFVISYTAYVMELFFTLEESPLWSTTLQAAYGILGFLVVYIFALTFKELIQKNEVLSKVTKELQLKTIEQQETNSKLFMANKELEELTALKERNRIAREIHDTIGHRLTTAIVEMEAGKTIFASQQQTALDKFVLAQQQIKKCLEEVRISVRSLKSDKLKDFDKSIIELFEDVEKHAGIHIKHDLQPMENKTSKAIQQVLFRVIQEGITNSIRHGNSTIIVITLYIKYDEIWLTIQDNGKGCSCIVEGFGLRSMNDRITEVGGSLQLDSEEDEGFTVSAKIPITK